MPQKQTSNLEKELLKRQEIMLEEINGLAKMERPDARVDLGEGRSALRPAMFLPEPPMGGDPIFLQQARKAYRKMPYGKISKIMQGNTLGSISSLIGSGIKPEIFGYTNLLGTYDHRDNSIGINPHLKDAFPTLIHELVHSKGLGEGPAYAFGDLFKEKPDEEIHTMNLTKKPLKKK